MTFLLRLLQQPGAFLSGCLFRSPSAAIIATVMTLGARDAGAMQWTLLPAAQVDGQGIYLSHVIAADPMDSPPRIRLGDAPAFGQALTLTRDQLTAALRSNVTEWAAAEWIGAERIRITRRSRVLGEAELKEKLTSALQRDYVRERGELELRLTRVWNPVMIPDDDFTIRILDLPTMGVSANFIVRFELATAREAVGSWHLPAQAKVWKEIWVARAALTRNELLTGADVERERRDVLGLREAVLDAPVLDGSMEISQSVPAGSPIYLRSLRVRPVVHRGQVVEAHLKQGTILISMKVEVLEEGVPGALVRVRNIQSRREFRGKVYNEQIILVIL